MQQAKVVQAPEDIVLANSQALNQGAQTDAFDELQLDDLLSAIQTSVDETNGSGSQNAAPISIQPNDAPASEDASQSIQKNDDYYSFASFMAKDRELAQFKRFGELNVHNLLMQQAELIYLESDLRAQALSDGDQRLNHGRSVQDMLASSTAGKDREQWDLILKIRKILKEYNEALLLQAQLWKLPAPRRYDASVLRYWLAMPEGGNNFLKGTFEHLPYMEDQSFDLVTVSERNCDSFMAWIAEKFMPWAVRVGIMKRGQKDSSLSWADSNLHKIARIIAIVASALIPSLAILILYYTPNTIGRIFVAMGLSMLFSMALAFMAIARPAEVFAATAAFAAVLVVFIGSASVKLK